MNSRELLLPCAAGVGLFLAGLASFKLLPIWLAASVLGGVAGALVVFLMVRWKSHRARVLGRILQEARQSKWIAELQRIGLETPLQWTDFSIAPDAACILVGEVLRKMPEVVVECGSGISTVLIAHCLRKLGKGRVYSLEHEAGWAEKTRQLLQAAGLERYASVIEAPLEPRKINREIWQWYSGFETYLPNSGIDFLFVDGPPPLGAGRVSRHPAVPVLGPRLSESALVLLDDANRPEEKKAVNGWISSFGCRLLACHPTERGLAVLESPGASTIRDTL